jgi:hypothetical protein
MENKKLKNFEIKELELMIPQIEKMYNFEFEKDETYRINNFEELCDLIIEKVNLKNVDSCTSQQAFYKLRDSLVETKIIEKENLKLETELKLIFPRKNRKAVINKLETQINFKLDILKTPDFIIHTLALIGIISFVLLFFYLKLGIIGMAISIFGFYLCKCFGNELKVKTVKELVEKITNENYLVVRSEKNSINKTELKNVLTNWFSENSGIEKEKLKTATFI